MISVGSVGGRATAFDLTVDGLTGRDVVEALVLASSKGGTLGRETTGSESESLEMDMIDTSCR